MTLAHGGNAKICHVQIWKFLEVYNSPGVIGKYYWGFLCYIYVFC